MKVSQARKLREWNVLTFLGVVLMALALMCSFPFAARGAEKAPDTIRIESDSGDSFAIMSTNIVKIQGDGFPDDIYGAHVAVFSKANDGNDKPFGTGYYTIKADRCTKTGGMVVLDEEFERVGAFAYDLTDDSDTWVKRVVKFLCAHVPGI